MKPFVRLLIAALLCATVRVSCVALQSKITELTQKGEAGDAQSQFELANAYEKGNGVEQNQQIAFQWCRKAAEQNYAKAQNALGMMYRRGIGVSPDKEEAFRWYKKAATQGLSEADYNVAISYFNGDGVGADLNRAYGWMWLAKQHGNSSASSALKKIKDKIHDRTAVPKLFLAEMLLKGEETPRDVNAAIAIVKETISHQKHGFADAGELEYQICQNYAQGKFISQNYVEARQWCRQAAESEYGPAFVMLGRMAEQGSGAATDLKQAEMWYRDAAMLYVPEGYMQLARLKSRGNSHRNMVEAYFWLCVAQRQKVEEAAPLLQEIAAQLTSEEIAEQQKLAIDLEDMSYSARLEELKYP